MVEVDEHARAWLEKQVDIVMNDPKKFEDLYSLILQAQGIEPTLETILSSISGYMLGYVTSMFIVKYGRDMTSEEEATYLQLLKRRAWEMREALLNTRIRK